MSEYNLERAELVGELYDRMRAGLEVDVPMQERAHALGINIEEIEDAATAEYREDEEAEPVYPPA